MPKLLVPEDKFISLSDSAASISKEAGAVAAGAKLGELQQNDAANAVADTGKLGAIQRTQASQALADTGVRIVNLIGKNEADAAASYAQIGHTALEAGQQINQQGQQMLQKAMDAMTDYVKKAKGAQDDAEYNDSYSGASQEFNKRASDRMNQPYDQQGNPTYASLSQDIGGIANDVHNKYSKKLSYNPEMSQKFSKNFRTMTDQYQLSQ